MFAMLQIHHDNDGRVGCYQDAIPATSGYIASASDSPKCLLVSAVWATRGVSRGKMTMNKHIVDASS